MGREKAKDEAACKGGVDRRTIDRDLKQYEPDVRRDLEYAERGRARGGEEPIHWKLTLRYRVNPTALSQHFMS